MSLVVVERKAQQERRPGSGFAGVFFKLLDWNRRLARKKLFRRKLLPPVRATNAPANKFVADDKMPLGKFILLDDENQGGFSSRRKPDGDLRHGMRAPGLLARLMGLDSMPVAAHERPRKGTDSSCFGKKESDHGFHRVDRELCVEDGDVSKLETRPQKLQKTGGLFFERQPIDGHRAKPGAPGKKNVLPSLSKTKFHSSALSAKSPRLPSDRLMRAASKILEPDLKRRDRTKSAITCIDSLLLDIPAPGLGSSMSHGGLGGKFMLQIGDDGESAMPKFGSSGLELSNSSCSRTGFLENRLILPVLQGETIRDKKTDKPVRSKNSLQNNVKDIAEKSNRITSKTKQEGSSTTTLARNQQHRQSQSTMMKDTIAFGSKVCSRKQERTGTDKSADKNDSASAGKMSSSCDRLKSSNEQNNDRNTLDKNIARKRTISSFGIKNADTFSSSCAKQCAGYDSNTREQSGHTIIRTECKRSIRNDSNDYSEELSSRNDNILSFTFNTKVRRASSSSSFKQVEGKSSSKNESLDGTDSSAILVPDEYGNTKSKKRNTLKADELSNMLEQKIRELTSMYEDTLAARDENSVSPSLKDQGAILQQNGFTSLPIQQTNVNQYEDEAIFSPFSPEASVLGIHNNQLSPISILDASFSNESSFVGSLIASSGEKLHLGFTESYNTTQSTNLDTELSDSATSVDFTRPSTNKMQYFAGISSSKSELELSKSELCEARHFISNAALLFENYGLCRLDGSAGVSLDSFFSDMLQAIASALHIGAKPDSIKVKERDQFLNLVFDCMIEFLDSKYSWCCNSAYLTYRRIPFLLTQERLMREVYKEIIRWIDLAGRFLDDLIENEMRNSTGKWIDCKREAFEAGTEIDSNILETLVEELLIDFF